MIERTSLLSRSSLQSSKNEKEVLDVGKAEDLYAKKFEQDKKTLASNETKLASYYNLEIDIIIEIRGQILKRSQSQVSKKATIPIALEGVNYVSWPIFEHNDPRIFYNLLSDGRFVTYNENDRQAYIYDLKKVERCSHSRFGRFCYEFTITEFRLGMVNLARGGFGIHTRNSWIEPPDHPTIEPNKKSFFGKFF